MATITNLRRIRERLGLTQEALTRRTTLSFSAYRNAEGGKRVTYGTATEILNAINAVLQEKQEDPLKMEDLGLTLY